MTASWLQLELSMSSLDKSERKTFNILLAYLVNLTIARWTLGQSTFRLTLHSVYLTIRATRGFCVLPNCTGLLRVWKCITYKMLRMKGSQTADWNWLSWTVLVQKMRVQSVFILRTRSRMLCLWGKRMKYPEWIFAQPPSAKHRFLIDTLCVWVVEIRGWRH